MSIRTRLLIALLALVGGISILAGMLTYRRVLAETSTLFDYQLRQMALSLRSQIPERKPATNPPPLLGATHPMSSSIAQDSSALEAGLNFSRRLPLISTNSSNSRCRHQTGDSPNWQPASRINSSLPLTMRPH